MVNVKLPYNKAKIDLNIDKEKLKGILNIDNAFDKEINLSEKEIVEDALKNPIKSEKLSNIAKEKENIVIITSDNTRPLPSKITLPLLIKEIRKKNTDANITILVATGLHRAMTEKEKLDKFGEEIVNNEKIVMHDAHETDNMIDIGKLPSGKNCSVNSIAYKSDLIICEGCIEPHFFAGFSGGRKSILPGISSEKTINSNHSAKAIAHPLSKTGVLEGNIIHRDMLAAANKLGVDFILNIVLNSQKKIIKAYAGNLNDAHYKGCEYVKKIYGVKKIMADVVITTNGGYPLDQNLYQCAKGITTAMECAKRDGIIIMVASCCDGIGGECFGNLMQQGTPQELMTYLFSISEEKTISEQWCVQKFAQALLKYKVILVSDYLDPSTVKNMNLIPAANVDEALKIAYDIKGKNISIVVIPDGVSVITE